MQTDLSASSVETLSQSCQRSKERLTLPYLDHSWSTLQLCGTAHKGADLPGRKGAAHGCPLDSKQLCPTGKCNSDIARPRMENIGSKTFVFVYFTRSLLSLSLTMCNLRVESLDIVTP